jgi:4-hydroxybenzoate polyprenyltransferase
MSFFLPLSLASPGAYPDWRSIPALLHSNWQLPALFFLNSVFLDLRDERGDALAGVTTLAVALGTRRAALLLAASCAVLAAALFARGEAVPAAFCLFLAAASAGALRAPGRDYYNHVILIEDAACMAALLI